jgi:hypothetical protein
MITSQQCFLPKEPHSNRFFLFIKRMVHYCREVISCISSDQKKSFLANFDKKVTHPDLILQESIANVEMILQLLTKLLQRDNIHGVGMKQVMNQNAAGQLVIDIISLGGVAGAVAGASAGGAGESQASQRGRGSLLDGALACGIELLHGGHNASCQRISFRYLASPPRAEEFFEAVQRQIRLVSDKAAAAAVSSSTSVRSVEAGGGGGGGGARGGGGGARGGGGAEGGYRREEDAALCGDLQQLGHLLRFLQLLCEGHYLDMQLLIFAQRSFLQDCVLLFQSLVNVTSGMGRPFLLVHALVLMRMLDFFTEIVQGPCLKNQEVLLKNEAFITSLDQLASYTLPASSIVWDDVPRQCLRFEALQNTRNLSQQATQTKFARLLNFAELKGIKNRVLLLQVSLLEGRHLAPSDAAGFMAKTLKDR